MELRRFFVKKENIKGKVVTLEGDEFNHAVKVLRQKVGFTIIVCDGDGYDYHAKITDIQKNYLIAEIIFCEKNFATPTKNITLYQGNCKLGKNDFIVQKAVELGVSKIVFFNSKNVSAKKINVERLNKIAVEACKQCGRSDIVTVEKCDFNDLPKLCKGATIMFYENEREKFLKDINLSNFKNVNIIIGSEGGFDDSEVAICRKKGFAVLSLGSRVLRAETASIVGVALVQDKIGGLE